MRFYRKLSTTSFLLLGSNKSCQSFFFTAGISTKLAARHSRLIAHTTTNNLHDDATTNNNEEGEIVRLKTSSDLSDSIREAWNVGETDGILKLARQFDVMQTFSVTDVIDATLLSVTARGHVAGIMNSWIGSCCQMEDKDLGAELAWELLTAYDDNTVLEDIEPDLVALSLTYSAMTQADNTDYHSFGVEALERARRLAKKEGGTKWRKSVAASNRKKPQRALDIRDNLENLYGISILHESDDDLILSKPSGMACFHRLMTTSGKFTRSRKRNKQTTKNNNNNTTIDVGLETVLLNHAIPLSSLNVPARGIVHRLDRGTSGCIILAKTDERHAELVTQFFLRQVEKSYDALVQTTENNSENYSKQSSGEITLPVHGRPALSYYEVRESYDTKKDDTIMLSLRIRTKTGRKHQVRVHCAKGLGMPIINDSKYSNDDDDDNNNETEGNRFCLHASTLLIPGIPIVEAPTPKWWEEAIQEVS